MFSNLKILILFQLALSVLSLNRYRLAELEIIDKTMSCDFMNRLILRIVPSVLINIV